MNVRLHHLGLAVTDVDATIDTLIAVFAGERVQAPAAGHALVRIGDLLLALVSTREHDPKARAHGDHLALTLPREARDAAVVQLGARGWGAQDVRGRVYVRSPDHLLTIELMALENTPDHDR